MICVDKSANAIVYAHHTISLLYMDYAVSGMVYADYAISMIIYVIVMIFAAGTMVYTPG